MLKLLFDKKLLLITGKGGVGKSTLTLSLGKAALQQGKRVLLITFPGQNLIANLYSLKSPLGYKAQKLEKNLYALGLDAQQSLREYALRQVKLEILYRYVFKNKVVKYFIEVTPGLNDLLFFGKIYDFVLGKKKKSYDLIILDMPATGHGITMLQTPRKIIDMIQVGPLYKNAKAMNAMLSNSQLTGICIATLAEEMPVNETLEMAEKIQKELQLPLMGVLVNGLYPKVFQQTELEPLKGRVSLEEANAHLRRRLLQFAQSQHRRQLAQEAQVVQLSGQFPDKHLVKLPFVFDKSFQLSSIEQISQHLAK